MWGPNSPRDQGASPSRDVFPSLAASESRRDSKTLCFIYSSISIFLRSFCPSNAPHRVSKPSGAPAGMLGGTLGTGRDSHAAHQPTGKHQPHSLSQKSPCGNAADVPADGTAPTHGHPCPHRPSPHAAGGKSIFPCINLTPESVPGMCVCTHVFSRLCT